MSHTHVFPLSVVLRNRMLVWLITACVWTSVGLFVFGMYRGLTDASADVTIYFYGVGFFFVASIVLFLCSFGAPRGLIHLEKKGLVIEYTGKGKKETMSLQSLQSFSMKRLLFRKQRFASLRGETYVIHIVGDGKHIFADWDSRFSSTPDADPEDLVSAIQEELEQAGAPEHAFTFKRGTLSYVFFILCMAAVAWFVFLY